MSLRKTSKRRTLPIYKTTQIQQTRRHKSLVQSNFDPNIIIEVFSKNFLNEIFEKVVEQVQETKSAKSNVFAFLDHQLLLMQPFLQPEPDFLETNESSQIFEPVPNKMQLFVNTKKIKRVGILKRDFESSLDEFSLYQNNQSMQIVQIQKDTILRLKKQHQQKTKAERANGSLFRLNKYPEQEQEITGETTICKALQRYSQISTDILQSNHKLSKNQEQYVSGSDNLGVQTKKMAKTRSAMSTTDPKIIQAKVLQKGSICNQKPEVIKYNLKIPKNQKPQPCSLTDKRKVSGQFAQAFISMSFRSVRKGIKIRQSSYKSQHYRLKLPRV